MNFLKRKPTKAKLPATKQTAPNQQVKGCVWPESAQPDGVCGGNVGGTFGESSLCFAHLSLASRRGSVPKAPPKIEAKQATDDGKSTPASKPRAIASKPRQNGGQYRFGVPTILVIFSHPILYLAPVVAVGIIYFILTNPAFRDRVFGNLLVSTIILAFALAAVWARLVYERGRYLVFDTKKNVVMFYSRRRASNPFGPTPHVSPPHREIQDFQVNYSFVENLLGIGEVTIVKMGKDTGGDDIVFKVMDPEGVHNMYFAWTEQDSSQEELDELYEEWKLSHGVIVSLILWIWRLFQGVRRGLSKLGQMRLPTRAVSSPVALEATQAEDHEPEMPSVVLPLIIDMHRGQRPPPVRMAGQNFVHCSVIGCNGYVGGAMTQRVPVVLVYADDGDGGKDEAVVYLHDPNTEIPAILKLWRQGDFVGLKRMLDFGDAVFPSRV